MHAAIFQRPSTPTFAIALVVLPIASACTATPGESDGAAGRSDVAANVSQAMSRLEASEGGRTVLRAIDAAGGLEAWYAAPTSAYAWEYSNAPSDLRFKSHLVADNATRRIYHRLVSLGTPEDPEPVEARFAWDGTDAWIWPAEIEGLNVRFWASTGFYFSSIPFVLADPGIVYEAMPDQELDGVMYESARVGYEPGIGDASDTYTVYVDKQTGRLRAIRYTVTFGGRPARGETLFYYDDYTTVDGLTVPAHFIGYQFADGQKGEFKNEAWVSEISFREPFDESQLTMPVGGRIQPMPGS